MKRPSERAFIGFFEGKNTGRILLK